MDGVDDRIGEAATGHVDLDVLEDLLSFYVRSVNYGLSRDLDRRLAGLEVARGTGKITTLLLLDSHPGIRPSEIASATIRDRSAITRIVRAFVAAGLVEQRPSPDEWRAQELYVTPRGHELAERVRRVAKAQSEEYFAALTEEDRAHLMRILRGLYLKERDKR